MHILSSLLAFCVMIAATLGIVRYDENARAAKRAANPPAAPNFNEPDRSTLLALTVICNLGALPYYFYMTRQRASGALLGVALCGCVLVLMVLTSLVFNLIARMAGFH
jgi:hypothetical protein